MIRVVPVLTSRWAHISEDGVCLRQSVGSSVIPVCPAEIRVAVPHRQQQGRLRRRSSLLCAHAVGAHALLSASDRLRMSGRLLRPRLARLRRVGRGGESGGRGRGVRAADRGDVERRSLPVNPPQLRLQPLAV